MKRILSNYLRMALSLAIGLYLVRRLIGTDDSVFAVYSVVVVGLGLGIMIKEALRIALVPLIGRGTNRPSDGDGEDGLFRATGQGVTVAIGCAALGFVLACIIAMSFDMFDFDERYREPFAPFVLWRAIGYGFVIVTVPLMTLLAYDGRMIAYNVVLLAERLADLLLVEVAIAATGASNGTVALDRGAQAYALACLVSLVALSAYVSRYRGRAFLPRPAALGRATRAFLWDSARGSLTLVVAMALNLRFSLVLVNVLFGEASGIAYALAVQIASYLRQAVMGLVTGVDSMFVRQHGGRSEGVSLVDLNRRVSVNTLCLLALAALLNLLIPHVVDLLAADAIEARDKAVMLARFLTLGVLVLSVSETWMQLLISLGDTLKFSVPVLIVVIGTPLSTLGVWVLDLPEPMRWIGSYFVVSSIAISLLVIPSVLQESLLLSSLRSLLAAPLRVATLFVPVMLLSVGDPALGPVAVAVAAVVAVGGGLWLIGREARSASR